MYALQCMLIVYSHPIPMGWGSVMGHWALSSMLHALKIINWVFFPSCLKYFKQLHRIQTYICAHRYIIKSQPDLMECPPSPDIHPKVLLPILACCRNSLRPPCNSSSPWTARKTLWLKVRWWKQCTKKVFLWCNCQSLGGWRNECIQIQA